MGAMAMAATRSGHGLLARLSASFPGGRLAASTLHCSNANGSSHLSFRPRSPISFPRIFASSLSGSSGAPPSPASSSSSSASQSPFAPSSGGISKVILPPEERPRMPAVPEERPKPTTAVAVVEAYLDKLWRDFFTNPHNWYDNRLRRRAPKYADFKNKLTKEGLWITAKWNPLWVRTELSLMTSFRAVAYDDPLWAKAAAEEEEERREKPPPVPPGAWLQEELKLKREKAAAAAAGTVTTTATVETWRRSDVSSANSAAPATELPKDQQ